MAEEPSGTHKSFWATLPGILTGLAGLITAIVGLLVALNQIGVIGHNTAETPPPTNGDPAPDPTPDPPSPQATPSEFRIIELKLRADPFNYRGKCPVTIKFSGRISVAGGGGTVSYKFLRSDGASAPVQTVNFSQPGSRTVTTTWRLGKSYSGWQAIQSFDPAEQQSNRARFRILCTNTLVPKLPLAPKAPTLQNQ